MREGTLNAIATPRLKTLSEPKALSAGFKTERSVYSYVSDSARNSQCSHRLTQLSIPKQRADHFCYAETQWGQTLPVSAAARNAQATPHIEDLAHHKDYHHDYLDQRQVQWPVSTNALKALASLRLQQLARPRSRTMIIDDFNPYIVSVAARRARGTPRLEELCVPLPRKVRQKKFV